MKLQMNVAWFLAAALLFGLVACSDNKGPLKSEFNENASLPGDLPYHPLQWRVITTAINKKDATMYTLFGNDMAIQYSRTNSQNDYPVGAVLALVTWAQRDDDRWFGGKIPDRVKSVEFVSVGAGVDRRPSYSYQGYEGTPLKKTVTHDGLIPNDRAAYLLTQRAAVMP